MTIGVKKLGDGAIGQKKKFDDIFSRLDAVHKRDGRIDRLADRHSATGRTTLKHSVAR